MTLATTPEPGAVSHHATGPSGLPGGVRVPSHCCYSRGFHLKLAFAIRAPALCLHGDKRPTLSNRYSGGAVAYNKDAYIEASRAAVLTKFRSSAELY